jgi:hypothetical protein
VIQVEKHVSVNFSVTLAKFVYGCQIHELGKILPKVRNWQSSAKDVYGCHFFGLSTFSTSSVFKSAKVVYGCQFHVLGRILSSTQNWHDFAIFETWQPTSLPYTKINTDMFLDL